MSSAVRASLSVPEVVIDHVSAQGPNVTHIRGTLIVSSRENLRELGVYDDYARLLPSHLRDTLLYAVASTWLPIEVGLTHYRTCDELGLNPIQINRLGQMGAERMIDTFAGRALKLAHSVGAESYWMLMSKNDRMYDRMYQGGGVAVIKLGPKDVMFENTGQPLVAIRFWRALYLGYMEGVSRAFSKASYVRMARPRVASPYAIAVTGSWV